MTYTWLVKMTSKYTTPSYLPIKKKEKINALIGKFEEHCSPKKTVTCERYKFNTCSQNGRPLNVFLVDLRSRPKTCEFGGLQNSLIRDRIVCGIDNNAVRERLLQDNALSFDKATDWVNSLVIIEKKDRSLRLCPDPKYLNVAIKR